MSETTKLLKACVEYRAMVDKLEAENAAQLVRSTDVHMAEKLEDIMRIWARLAAEEIKANVR